MIARTDDKVMNKAVFILHKMSEDEKMQELARIRERAMHDEASYLEDAREEGRQETISDALARMKALGMSEDLMKQIFPAAA